MSKNIVVEVDEDGFVVSVYCPDETYVVDLLDHRDWNRGEGLADVQESTKDLKNCF
jgi:hypothetical protein